MTTSYSNPPQEIGYQPTPAQQARAAALRRFNLWAVYIPLGVITALILTLVVALIVLAVIQPRWRPMASAVADLLLILAIGPALLFTVVIPGAVGYVVIDGRRKGRTPLASLRTLLWRLDTLISTIQHRVGSVIDRIAPPTARLRANFVRLEATARRLAQRNSDTRSM